MRDMVCLCVVSLALAGGSAHAQQRDGDEALASDLRNIGAAWIHVEETRDRAPTNIEDVIKVLGDLKEFRAVERLRSGSVLIYGGFRIRECRLGTSNTVLAYDVGTPVRGGWMVMVDGFPQRLSKDAFQSAPKPKDAYLLKLAKPADAVGKITLDEGNTEKEVSSEIVEAEDGVVTEFTRRRTITREVNYTVTAGLGAEAEARVKGSLAVVGAELSTRIKASIETSLGERLTATETREQKVTIDGSKIRKAKVSWVDTYRTGSVQVAEGGTTYPVRFALPIGTKLVIKKQ